MPQNKKRIPGVLKRLLAMASPEQLGRLAAVVPAAQHSMRLTGIPASITLAQWLIESSWGTSKLAVQGGNYFGVKYSGRAGEQYIEMETAEYVKGVRVMVQARFRKYATVQDSFDDHARLISSSKRYAPAMRAAADPQAFAIALQTCGYSTNPKYAEQLWVLVRQFKLLQYDVQAGQLAVVRAMAGKGIVIKIEGDGDSAKRALDMVKEHLHETAKAEQEVAEAAEFVKKAMEFAGVAYGIEELKEKFKEMVAEALEYGETLSDASKQTGLSASTLSVLHQAATITGTDFAQITAAVSKFDVTIAAAAGGEKKAESFIKSLGLNAKQLANDVNGPDVAFKAFIKTLGETESPIRRAELAKGLLGKAGTALIPVLLDIAEGYNTFEESAKKAGNYLTQEQAEALEETNHKMHELQSQIEGAGLQIVEGLLPALNQMFSVLQSGRSSQDTLQEWGRDIGITMAGVAEVLYSVASAAELVFGVAEGGKLTEAGRKDLEAAKQLKEQAEQFHDIAFGGSKAPSISAPVEVPGSKPRGPGFGGVDHSAEAGKSQDAIVRAAASLAAEQAKAEADARKAIDEQALSDLDARHKMGLVSDGEYYEAKLRLQTDALDGEAKALSAKQAALQDQLDKERRDKLAKRDKSGNSAEQLNTQRELLQVQEQMAALQTRRTQMQNAHDTEVYGADAATELQTLRLAADFEKERGDSLEAQIALLRRRNELEVDKIRKQGGTDGDVQVQQQLSQIEETKLRINDVEKRISESLAENKSRTEALNDAAAKDPRLKREVTQQVNQLNLQEAQAVAELIRQYDELAQQLGGPFKQKAAELKAELVKLSTPDNRENAKFAKDIQDGLAGISKSLIDTAALGKQSFGDMVASMTQDILRLALKISEEKWLEPLFQGGAASGSGGGGFWATLFGAAGAPRKASGGLAGGWLTMNEAGPEMVKLPNNSTVVPNQVVKQIAENGGNGGPPNVQQNIINKSSQPVTASQPRVDYNHELKSFIIETYLEDHQSGGPLYQLRSGG